MKVIAIVSLAGAMLATTAMAQSGNTWQSQWLTAKYGRTFSTGNTPENLHASRPATRSTIGLNPAARDEKASASPVLPWREQWFKAKYGRYSPLWESEHNVGQQNDPSGALLAAPSRTQSQLAANRNAWRDQIMKMKYGR